MYHAEPVESDQQYVVYILDIVCAVTDTILPWASEQ